MDARPIEADDELFTQLERRLGRTHARLRLGLEDDHEAQVFGQGMTYFHPENLPLSHAIIRTCLRLTGLYGRGQRNAAALVVRDNLVCSKKLPRAFSGFSILHLTDLHVEISGQALTQLQGCCRHSPTIYVCSQVTIAPRRMGPGRPPSPGSPWSARR